MDARIFKLTYPTQKNVIIKMKDNFKIYDLYLKHFLMKPPP